EARGERTPHRERRPRDRGAHGDGSHGDANDRGADRVVAPGRPTADALAVQARIFLVEQRIEADLAVAGQALAPSRSAHRVLHHRVARAQRLTVTLQQLEVKIRILAPRAGEALV